MTRTRLPPRTCGEDAACRYGSPQAGRPPAFPRARSPAPPSRRRRSESCRPAAASTAVRRSCHVPARSSAPGGRRAPAVSAVITLRRWPTLSGRPEKRRRSGARAAGSLRSRDRPSHPLPSSRHSSVCSCSSQWSFLSGRTTRPVFELAESRRWPLRHGTPRCTARRRPVLPGSVVRPRPPLLLLGPVAVGVPIELIRLTGPLLLFAALLVFYALLRRSVRPGLALAATWALGLYLPFFTVLTNLHSEPLAAFRRRRDVRDCPRARGRKRRLACRRQRARLPGSRSHASTTAGCTRSCSRRCSCGGRCRGQGPRRLAAMAALACACPVVAYTASETGRLFVWGNSGSLSLYWMLPRAGGPWRLAAGE